MCLSLASLFERPAPLLQEKRAPLDAAFSDRYTQVMVHPKPERETYIERVGWSGPMRTFPIFLVGLEKRRVLVVGGGHVAAEKVRALLDGGAAQIDVVAPELSEALAPFVDGERVRHLPRAFDPADLDGAFLSIAATDDPETNRRVFEEAETRGVLSQVVDDPAHCAFIMPSVVRRGDLTVAISTGGASPALAVRLRERLEQELGEEYAAFVRLAGELRPVIMDSIADPAVRKELWYRIVDSDVLRHLKEGDFDRARAEAEALLRAAGGTTGVA